jgi:hypothetical protein
VRVLACAFLVGLGLGDDFLLAFVVVVVVAFLIADFLPLNWPFFRAVLDVDLCPFFDVFKVFDLCPFFDFDLCTLVTRRAERVAFDLVLVAAVACSKTRRRGDGVAGAGAAVIRNAARARMAKVHQEVRRPGFMLVMEEWRGGGVKE